LLTDYRHHLDFSFEALDAAGKELARLNTFIVNLRLVRRGGGPHKEIDELVEQTDRGFFGALQDDLNVPRAKARLFELLRDLNPLLHSEGFSSCDAQLALDLLCRADRILAVLDFTAGARLEHEVESMIEERRRAREAGDYARADALRRELSAAGVTIEDTPGGSRARRKS
jgi:cysteinyl-tRNA synthetase